MGIAEKSPRQNVELDEAGHAAPPPLTRSGACSILHDVPVTSPAEGAKTLRVLFITENDPLYVIRFFDRFLVDYPRDRFALVGMTIVAPFRESLLATARRMLSFYGVIASCRLALRFAVAKLRRRSIATLAGRQGIPLVETTSVNEPGYIDRLRELEPDVIVSVAAPEIFREQLLSTPRLGCVNLHSGRLPRFRGMMPTFWQMVDGERQATVTVHEMAPEVDAGRILGTVECRIHEHDSVDRMMVEAKVAGAQLMIQVLGEIADGTVAPRPLDMSEASYYSFPKRQDARRLLKRGHTLL
jgi:methionyl-tRNA formyltransferase